MCTGDVNVYVSPEIAEGPSLRLDARDFRVRVDGGASLPLPLKAPLVVKAGARITLEAQKEHWFALQLRKATKAEMTNPTEVRESIRQEYLAGRWSLDDYVVIERVRCGDGFAILGEGKGTAFAFTVGASLTLLTGHELVNGSLAPKYRTSDFSYDSFVFDASDPNGQLPTPTFAAPMGIDRKRWARLPRGLLGRQQERGILRGRLARIRGPVDCHSGLPESLAMHHTH
jgi:hypothetical protein